MHRPKWFIVVALTALVGVTACKKNEETTKPEDDTWVPDEDLEAANAPPPKSAEPQLSEEERLEQAKGLYREAEAKAAEEDWVGALPLYEQAYQLVPGKHGFALKVGLAAEKAGDCAKATTYLQHFVTYATEDKYQDDRTQAEALLAEIEKRGC